MVDTEKVLRFLQGYKFDMMREVPGFVDAHIAKDGSAKLVLRVSAPLAERPVFSFEGEEIPLDISVDFPDAKPVDKTVVLASPLNPVATQTQPPQRHVGEVALPEKIAISPHESGGHDKAAFEAWKMRHSHIKVR